MHPDPLAFPQLLRGNSQRTIELAGSILPGEDLREFHNGIVVILLAQTAEELVAHVAAGNCRAVDIFKRGALNFVVKRTGLIVGQVEDLLRRDAEFATDGRIDILSKLATVETRYPAIDERLQFCINQARCIDSRPHCSDTTKDRGPSRVNHVVQQRCTPFLRLPVKDTLDVRFNSFRVYSRDSCHAHATFFYDPLQRRMFIALRLITHSRFWFRTSTAERTSPLSGFE